MKAQWFVGWCALAVLRLGVWANAAGNSAGEIADVTWTLGPNLPEFRKGGCLTVLDGNVVSVFGMRFPWGEMATMYNYDPATASWSRCPDAPLGQTYCNGTRCESAFYVIGGRSAQEGGVHPLCFRLELKTGRYVWTQIARLNEGRGWAPSASVGKKVFVFGGAKDGHGPALASVEMLDTTRTDVGWRVVAQIPGEPRGWAQAASVNGKIFLIGGTNFVRGQQSDEKPVIKQLREVLRYDPGTERWDTMSPLPFRLSGADCCVYKDRYIIVVGGYANSDDFSSEMKKIWQENRYYRSYYNPFVLVYDTDTNQWYRMADVLPMPTNDIRVVLIGNRLYALGGENIEPATSNTTPWLRIGEIQTRSSGD